MSPDAARGPNMSPHTRWVLTPCSDTASCLKGLQVHLLSAREPNTDYGLSLFELGLGSGSGFCLGKRAEGLARKVSVRLRVGGFAWRGRAEGPGSTSGLDSRAGMWFFFGDG